jgi:tetratricopeptide (TPR) repeat protein
MAPVETDDEDRPAVNLLWIEHVKPLMDSRSYSEAADMVRSFLRSEGVPSRRLLLLQHLIDCLSGAGAWDEGLPVLREMIDLGPDDPLNWSRLSGWYFYTQGSYAADEETLRFALEAIDRAIAKARVRGEWLRQCLNDRCRIAVAMKRYDLLEETMREILAIPPRRGVPDIRIEDDFLQRVPEGAVDARLLADYRKAYADQESRRASSPPSS